MWGKGILKIINFSIAEIVNFAKVTVRFFNHDHIGQISPQLNCGVTIEIWMWYSISNQGAVSIRKTVLPGMAIPMLKIRRPNGRLIVRRAGLLWSQRDFEWRWSVPLFKCLTVLEFSFILFDLCLLITFFNFIMNYVPIVTFWIFTYHKIWILSIMFCSIWSYWIIYFLVCLEVSWRVVS